METLSIQLSNLSEVLLTCGSDKSESDSRAAQPLFGVPIRDGQAGRYRLVGRISSTDADAWAAITPEGETESLGAALQSTETPFPERG